MVKSFFSLLSSRQTSILSGATILMVAVFASRFLGLIRDRMLVHYFDTSQTDIFFAALRLPDLMFQLLIFGSLSVAFIPVFTDFLNKKGEGEAFEFASNILNLSLVFFLLIEIIIFFFVSPLNSLILWGFTGERKEITDQLTRLALISQMILIVGSFFIGIGQSFQRFIAPALAPLFYNLGIIAGIALFSPFFGIAGPIMGVILGSFLHVAVQIPLIISLGFKYKLTFNFFNSGVREIFKLMSIRNIGLAAEQISDTIAVSLASLISPYSITLLTFAQHLQAVPIGLFGATIAQAALPVLSKEYSKGEMEQFKITLLTTMHQILFLTLPAASILIILRIPVVRLVFGASQFNWADTVLTGRTVAFLAAGLAAQSVILLLVRSFYAIKDTRTPVLVSIVTVIINILLSLFFTVILKMDVWGLGVAYAISTNISLVMLIVFLHNKIGGFNMDNFVVPAFKMSVAATIAAIALYIPMKALDQLVFDTTRTINLIILTGIASFFGLSIYLILVWLMRVRELHTYIELLKKFGRMKVLFPTKEIVNDPTST